MPYYSQIVAEEAQLPNEGLALKFIGPWHFKCNELHQPIEPQKLSHRNQNKPDGARG